MQGIRFYLLGFILIFSILSIPLVSLNPEKSIDQYLMKEWKISDGLPANTIRAITQTPDGFLWLGAGNTFVMVRFDGTSFNVFKNEINQKVKTSTIYEFFLDKKGILWIGSSQGLTRFHPRKGYFKTFSENDGLKGNSVFCICKDMKDNLWIGTDDGYLNRFNNGTFTAIDTAMGIANNWISSILEDNKGNLWLGTSESGLLKYQYGKLIKHPLIKTASHYSITYLFEDSKGILWIGTNKGLIRIHHTAATYYTCRDGMSNNRITNILEDHDENLWVGTLNGINRIKKNPDGSITIEKSLENNLITCLFEDKEENLWIGTNGSGLKCLKDSQVKTYTTADGLNNDFLFSLFEAKNGDIWIGSCVGLNRFDGEHITRFPHLTDYVITCIDEDHQGNLWMGTYGKGVVRISGDEICSYTEKDGYKGNYAISVLCDNKNRTWFGTDKGLILFHQGGFKTYTFPDGPLSNLITAIYKNKNRDIWVGTSDGLRVLPIQDEEINTKNLKVFFKGTLITSIYHDPSGLFWVGTDGAGLKRMNITPERFEISSFQVEQGLSSNKIYKLLGDENEGLWMCSDQGIIKVCRKALEEIPEGNTQKLNCTLYGISDGMKNPECIYSAIKTRKGELWFGTKKGIAIFNPERMKINKLPPPVIIEKIITDSGSIPGEVDNPSFRGINYIEFHFTAPTFIAPERIKFKTKLEGYENQWQLVSSAQNRTARYSNLPSGEYWFKVIASNRDGIWNNTGDSFSFSIKHYFYQATLFKITILFSLLFIGIMLFYFLRKHPALKNVKRKHKTSTLAPEKAEIYLKKLFHVIEVEKIYKNERLSLQSLSEKLSIPPRDLSQVINERLEMNYSNFINSYRIQEAKILLFAPEKIDDSILDIAYEVGFNSKAVFNRAFKKFTGMTPSEFRKNNGK